MLSKAHLNTVMDLGTGDGKFAYSFAQAHPDTLVIAIDADKQQMRELSHKANRKPPKGGLENLVFFWSAVEDLSEDLTDIAQTIYVNFPWGSLLAGTIKAEPEFISVFSRLLKPQGKLEIMCSYSELYEPQMMEKYQLPTLSPGYVLEVMTKEYLTHGLELKQAMELGAKQKAELQGSWPKSLVNSRAGRQIYKLVFKKNGV